MSTVAAETRGKPPPSDRPRVSRGGYPAIRFTITCTCGCPSRCAKSDWKEFWRQSGCPTLKSTDAAFLGFCKARYARRH